MEQDKIIEAIMLITKRVNNIEEFLQEAGKVLIELNENTEKQLEDLRSLLGFLK